MDLVLTFKILVSYTVYYRFDTLLLGSPSTKNFKNTFNISVSFDRERKIVLYSIVKI